MSETKRTERFLSIIASPISTIPPHVIELELLEFYESHESQLAALSVLLSVESVKIIDTHYAPAANLAALLRGMTCITLLELNFVTFGSMEDFFAVVSACPQLTALSILCGGTQEIDLSTALETAYKPPPSLQILSLQDFSEPKGREVDEDYDDSVAVEWLMADASMSLTKIHLLGLPTVQSKTAPKLLKAAGSSLEVLSLYHNESSEEFNPTFNITNNPNLRSLHLRFPLMSKIPNGLLRLLSKQPLPSLRQITFYPGIDVVSGNSMSPLAGAASHEQFVDDSYSDPISEDDDVSDSDDLSIAEEVVESSLEDGSGAEESDSNGDTGLALSSQEAREAWLEIDKHLQQPGYAGLERISLSKYPHSKRSRGWLEANLPASYARGIIKPTNMHEERYRNQPPHCGSPSFLFHPSRL
ncbi:hypothetical protein HWV62_15046 [Athelia sp. TMB]|nr:hypothetical protein HWV62_15046 [Athelia sp. TMB]